MRFRIFVLLLVLTSRPTYTRISGNGGDGVVYAAVIILTLIFIRQISGVPAALS
jgi:hypothetical protein